MKVQKPVIKKVNNGKCKNSVENHATRKGKLIDSQVKHMPPAFQEDQEKVNLTDKQESKRILDGRSNLNYQDNIKKNDIEKKKRLENEKKDQLFSLIFGDVMSNSFTSSNSTVSEPGEDSLECIADIKMVEETEYDEVVQCDVSSYRRCHTSYITNYESQQVEECEEL